MIEGRPREKGGGLGENKDRACAGRRKGGGSVINSGAFKMYDNGELTE